MSMLTPQERELVESMYAKLSRTISPVTLSVLDEGSVCASCAFDNVTVLIPVNQQTGD